MELNTNIATSTYVEDPLDEILDLALPILTEEEIMASLARSEEDIKAGRVCDAKAHIQELRRRVRTRDVSGL